MPHAIFTHPPLATVGATEQELRARGAEYLAVEKPFGDVVMGRALQDEHGLCKLLLAPDGAILGCHMLGPESTSLIQEVVLVMRLRNHVSSLTEAIHPPPARSEVLRDVAREGASQLRG
jgi:dihydrolipoamide dehydrogenase